MSFIVLSSACMPTANDDALSQGLDVLVNYILIWTGVQVRHSPRQFECMVSQYFGNCTLPTKVLHQCWDITLGYDVIEVFLLTFSVAHHYFRLDSWNSGHQLVKSLLALAVRMGVVVMVILANITSLLNIVNLAESLLIIMSSFNVSSLVLISVLVMLFSFIDLRYLFVAFLHVVYCLRHLSLFWLGLRMDTSLLDPTNCCLSISWGWRISLRV